MHTASSVFDDIWWEWVREFGTRSSNQNPLIAWWDDLNNQTNGIMEEIIIVAEQVLTEDI